VGGFFLSTTGSQSWPLIFMLMACSIVKQKQRVCKLSIKIRRNGKLNDNYSTGITPLDAVLAMGCFEDDREGARRIRGFWRGEEAAPWPLFKDTQNEIFHGYKLIMST
jgi:hypothetical protein